MYKRQDEYPLLELSILNPATNGRIVFDRELMRANIRLLTLDGRTVLTRGRFHGRALHHNLPSGIYLIQVTQDTLSFNSRIVIDAH